MNEPSCSTYGAAGVARVGAGCAPGIVAKETSVTSRMNVGAQARGAASVSIAGGARVVADDALIVDAGVGRYELVAISTLETSVSDLAEETGVDCAGDAVAEVEVGVSHGTGPAELVGGAGGTV